VAQARAAKISIDEACEKLKRISLWLHVEAVNRANRAYRRVGYLNYALLALQYPSEKFQAASQDVKRMIEELGRDWVSWKQRRVLLVVAMIERARLHFGLTIMLARRERQFWYF